MLDDSGCAYFGRQGRAKLKYYLVLYTCNKISWQSLYQIQDAVARSVSQRSKQVFESLNLKRLQAKETNDAEMLESISSEERACMFNLQNECLTHLLHRLEVPYAEYAAAVSANVDSLLSQRLSSNQRKV